MTIGIKYYHSHVIEYIYMKQRVWVASIANGSTKYFSQLKKYLRGENKKINIYIYNQLLYIVRVRVRKPYLKSDKGKQYNISSHLKWVLLADNSMHIIKVQ